MRQFATYLGVIFAVAFILGCSGSGNPIESVPIEIGDQSITLGNRIAQGDNEPLKVPYYSQGATNWCALTCAAMLLQYKGVPIKPREVAAHFSFGPQEPPGGWWFQPLDFIDFFLRLEDFAKSKGLKGNWKMWRGQNHDDQLHKYIIKQLDNGNPVMVGLDGLKTAITTNGHAIVAVGYTPTDIVIHDPSGFLFDYLKDKGLMEKPSSFIYQHVPWNLFNIALNEGFYDDSFVITSPPVAILAPVTLDVVDNGIYWGYDTDQCLRFLWDGKTNPFSGFTFSAGPNDNGYHVPCDSTLGGEFGALKVHGGDRLSWCRFKIANCYMQGNLARNFSLTLNLENKATGQCLPPVTANALVADGSYGGGNFDLTLPMIVWSEGTYLMRINLFEGVSIIDTWQIEFLVGPGVEPPPQGWSETTHMNHPRCGFTEQAVNGKIYVIGGWNTMDIDPSNTVECYDTITSEWYDGKSMPTARAACSSAVVNGLIYVFGGTPQTDVVEVYNPSTDTWASAGKMPSHRAWPMGEAINDKIFITGGFDGFSMLNTCWRFEPLNPVQKWYDINSMPIGDRSGHDIVVHNSYIYTLGGYYGSPLLRYNPVANSWTSVYELSSLPEERIHLRMGVLGNKIYATGGTIPPGGYYFKDVWIYDIPGDSWTPGPELPIPMQEHGAIVVGNTLYVFGGITTGEQITNRAFKLVP